MFWDCLDTSVLEEKPRHDLRVLFSQYPSIEQSIAAKPYAFAAASHLVNRVRLHADKKFLLVPEHIEDEFHAILAKISMSGAAESSNCLSPGYDGFDSVPYLLTSTSSLSNRSRNMIDLAKQEIARTSYAPVCRRLDDIVLITLAEQVFPNTNQSYTIQSVMQTIYLDLYEHPLLTAESIVHEVSHVTFNNYCYVQGHRFDPAPKYYSPWKEAERPLFNFLHSLVAFTDVILFLREVSRGDVDEVGRKYLNMKLNYEMRNLKSVLETANTALKQMSDRLLIDRVRTGLDRVVHT